MRADPIKRKDQVVNPEIEVEAPTRRPLPYGLFSAATERSEERRWSNGVEWRGIGCGTPFVTGQVCEDVSPFEQGDGGGMGEALPFTVYAPFECSPVAWTEQSATAMAQSKLVAGEEKAVERVLMTGSAGNTPSIQADAVSVTTTAVSPALLLARLEDWIAVNYGSLGVLHLTPGAATVFASEGLLKESGTRLLTKIGTPVAVGAGYVNESPDGTEAADNEFWAYMSPAVIYYQGALTGDVAVPVTLDRKKNDLLATAFRTYVVGYDDCGVAAGVATVN